MTAPAPLPTSIATLAVIRHLADIADELVDVMATLNAFPEPRPEIIRPLAEAGTSIVLAARELVR